MCCSSVVTALVLSALYDWESAGMVSDMVLLLVDLESIFFLSAIIFGFQSNVIMVDWDSLHHLSGEQYLDGS